MTKIQDVNTVSTTLWGRSAVMCGCFRSTCMPQHSQWSEWKNTGCHCKLEPDLAVIFRNCVRRHPNNQIRLWSSIYSPAILIKWLRYLAPALRAKKSLCLHQPIRFLRATVAHDTESRSEITTHVEDKIVAQKLHWSWICMYLWTGYRIVTLTESSSVFSVRYMGDAGDHVGLDTPAS